MPSNFTKQPQFLPAKALNSGSGDAQVGGTLTGVPANVAASQNNQTRPGDRMVLGVADALALSDTSIGTLYCGMYMYVKTQNSTATPTLGHVAFWDIDAADSLYQVTADGTDTGGINFPAGIFINTLTKTYHWWILIAGKVKAVFLNPLTGAAALGQAVFADSTGVLDVFDGGGNPTFTQVGTMLNSYLGVAEELPVAGGTKLVDVPLRTLYRF